MIAGHTGARGTFMANPLRDGTRCARAILADDRRSHFDVRELMYQRVFDDFELRAGLGRVFWGVTESYHLVDIINQTDLVEDIDLEDKLGQPLVNLTLIRDWGALDLFALPGCRGQMPTRDSHGSGRARPGHPRSRMTIPLFNGIHGARRAHGGNAGAPFDHHRAPFHAG